MKLKNQNKLNYRVWRINPHNKAIAPLLLDGSRKDFGLDIQRMIRAGTLGHIRLGEINGVELRIAADAGAQKGQPGVRFTGVDFEKPTSGIIVMFGSIRGGLCPAPVDKAWLEEHIVWTSIEETDAEEDDA